jgi:hypothetical protein
LLHTRKEGDGRALTLIKDMVLVMMRIFCRGWYLGLVVSVKDGTWKMPMAEV